MELGIYRRPSIDDDSDVYIRVALYDFDSGEWHESSSGEIVSKASVNPSPEELKVRFDLDPDARWTVVERPAAMEDAGHEVTVRKPEKSVEEGHAIREERGGPLVTQTERQAQKQQGVRVFPDDYVITEEDREFYEETIITESEWQFDFAEEYDLEF